MDVMDVTYHSRGFFSFGCSYRAMPSLDSCSRSPSVPAFFAGCMDQLPGKGGANMKASKLSKLSESGSPTRVVSHDLALSNFIEILNLSLKIT